MAKKAKASKKPAKRKAKVKLSAAAKESVVNIQASEQLAGNFLAKKDKLAKMDVDIARITGQRKDMISKRAELASELEEDAIELARVASGGHFEHLFTEAGIKADRANLRQQSEAGHAVTQVASNQASPNLPTLAQREKELESVTLKDLGITGKLAEKVESDGITTGAKLRQWLNEAFPRKIAGVADSAKDKLGDALNAWWVAHPYEDKGSAAATAPKAPIDKNAPLTKTTPEPIADQVRDSDAVDIINLKGKLILQIAPRRNEHFAYGYLLKIDKSHEHEQPWFGHYDPANRDQCYREALDAVTKKLHEWEAGSLPLAAIDAAKEIHAAIIDAGKLIHKRAKKAAVESGELAAPGA